MTDNFRDAKGYPVCEGDVLKVFHFVGPRNKSYFMYKLVMADEHGTLRAFCATEVAKKKSKPQSCALHMLGYFEIVAGHGPEEFYSYEQRERVKP